jgi:tripartite-type tricarboxylate transporter receptor subunit TctC
MKSLLCLLLVWVGAASAQPCPDKNVMYWQAFPPGGETDIAGRHQQIVLKKCPAIDMIISTSPARAAG